MMKRNIFNNEELEIIEISIEGYLSEIGFKDERDQEIVRRILERIQKK